MVQLRSIEGRDTYWWPPRPLSKAATTEPDPTAVSDIPRAMLSGAPTHGAAHGHVVEPVGTSEATPEAVSVASSSSIGKVRITSPDDARWFGESWRSRGYTESLRSGLGGRPLGVLSRPVRLETRYEPHFRQFVVERLFRLFERFRDGLGRPDAAARISELRSFLADLYKQSATDSETRNLATALSMLQDLIQPHWSSIGVDRVNEVAEILGWLRIQQNLTPQIIEKFYGRLSAKLGALSIEVNDDGQESADQAQD